MFKKRVEISFFTYSIVLILITSIMLLTISLLSPINDRAIFSFFYFLGLNIVILLGLAFFANYKYHPEKSFLRRSFYLITTLFYSAFFIGSAITYYMTTQSIHLQTVLFYYKINTFLTIVLVALAIVFALIIITFILNKKIKFKNASSKEVFYDVIILIIGIVMLAIALLLLPTLLNIKNPIVDLYIDGNPIYVMPEELPSENLITKKTYLREPNIIFILLESVNYDRLGFYGYERNITPNMDWIAKNSITFTHAYATAPHSDYAQPAYLSSRYMMVNDYRNFFDQQNNPTFAWDVFKQLNYTTGYISSQDDRWAGMNNYFNFSSLDLYSYSMTDGIIDYGSGIAQKDLDHKTMDKVLNWLNSSLYNYSTQFNSTTNITVTLKENAENPIFLYTNLQATHNPMVFPDEYKLYLPDDLGTKGLRSENVVNRFDNSLYYIDVQIGRLIEFLKKNNELNNTIIILSSDHGHDLYGLHGTTGHGYSVYDEEIRVPLMFYFPDMDPKIYNEPVSTIDVLPTVLDIMKLPPQKEFIGAPIKKQERLIFYLQNHKYGIGMLKNNKKTIIDLNRGLAEVYDLEKDPDELKNLVLKKNYDKEILELLMWHYCQINYFSVQNQSQDLKPYCEAFL
jgi:arylsulfatase A-like enzyme